MTLEELENTLPNGLHDSEVTRIAADYEKRSLVLDVSVWVGDMGDAPERRETYKRARIEISGLLFLVMEPPDPDYPSETGSLRINGCDLRKNLDSKLLDSLPSDAFFRSLWVSEWNAFIHIAAKETQMGWTDEAVVYRGRAEQGHPRRHIAPGEMVDS
jgi:hypothetical protein